MFRRLATTLFAAGLLIVTYYLIVSEVATGSENLVHPITNISK